MDRVASSAASLVQEHTCGDMEIRLGTGGNVGSILSPLHGEEVNHTKKTTSRQERARTAKGTREDDVTRNPIFRRQFSNVERRLPSPSTYCPP